LQPGNAHILLSGDVFSVFAIITPLSENAKRKKAAKVSYLPLQLKEFLIFCASILPHYWALSNNLLINKQPGSAAFRLASAVKSTVHLLILLIFFEFSFFLRSKLCLFLVFPFAFIFFSLIAHFKILLSRNLVRPKKAGFSLRYNI
jgi:ABC-type uncharacterized transport system permease subunit